MRATRLAVTACLLIIASAIGAALSISEGLPAEWGKGFAGLLTLASDPHDVLTGFLTWRGTALAPPLVLLVLVAGLALLARRSNRIGVAGLTLAGALMTVGYAGEPIARQVLFTDFEAQKAVLVIVQVALSIQLVVFGLRELRHEAPAAIGVPA